MNELLQIKAEMVLHRVKQRQVARLLDVGESYLSDVLNGFKPVNSDFKRRIREAIARLSGESEAQGQVHFPR